MVLGLIDKNVIYCISLVSNTLYDNISLSMYQSMCFLSLHQKTTKLSGAKKVNRYKMKMQLSQTVQQPTVKNFMRGPIPRPSE